MKREVAVGKVTTGNLITEKWLPDHLTPVSASSGRAHGSSSSGLVSSIKAIVENAGWISPLFPCEATLPDEVEHQSPLQLLSKEPPDFSSSVPDRWALITFVIFSFFPSHVLVLFGRVPNIVIGFRLLHLRPGSHDLWLTKLYQLKGTCTQNAQLTTGCGRNMI